MITKQYKIERVATGRYFVRLDGERLPGMILGGNRRYAIQLDGNQWSTIRKTLTAAAGDLVSHHYGLPVVF